MGFAAPLLIGGGIGLQAGSAYAEGRAAEADYKAQKAMAEYNASIAEQNALAAQQKGIFDQLRQLQRGREIMGTMVARQGISGARLDVGAPLMARHDQAAELELENLLIGYESQLEAQRHRIEAAGYGMEAKYAGSKAKYAKRAGTLNMISTLLSGFGTMAGEGLFEPKQKTTQKKKTGTGTPVAQLGTPSGSTSTTSRTSTSGAAHRAGK